MEKVTEIEKVKKFNMEENMHSHTTVLNLCNWSVYFTVEGVEKKIKANGTIDLLNREIVSACNNNDIFFAGTGQGSHARVYIENEDIRKHVGFESEDGKRKQNILNDEKCQYILDLKTQKTFEKHVTEEIITLHEKDKIMTYARKIKLNDFEKIDFLEKHCSKKYRI